MKRSTLLKTETPTDSEKIDWLRLTRTEHIGPVTFYQLMARFGSAAQALDALPELSKRGGRARPLIAAVILLPHHSCAVSCRRSESKPNLLSSKSAP